jgi:uncharacterized repeat protein (TIGR01451 family)
VAFPPNDEAAEVETDCLPIVDSFDPNDKQVSPIGFTENNYVRPGTELEYTIRFQNTGTAEAVNIVVIDTLSTDLDMTRFQMMSVSHPYKLAVSGKGRPILTWTFTNINLPDSTTNEPESHGYIKFKIKPNEGIAEGTIIENFADIYFDFNEPVRTNTTVSNITNYQFPVAPIDFCEMVRKSNAGQAQTTCESTFSLHGNEPNVGQGTWRVVNGAGSFVNSHQAITQVQNLGVGVNLLEWKIEGEGCSSVSTVKITRLAEPTQANGGTPQTICATSTQLTGNQALTGQGRWTLVSGSGQILNPNSFNSQVQNIGYGENTFRWNIGNGTCDSTHSTVKITRIHEASLANAGENKQTCESTIQLSGNTPQYGQGKWTRISGTGNLVNPNSPNTIVENLQVGESIFEWKISHGVCTGTQSQVKITRLPTQLNSVRIQSNFSAICAGESVTFTATPQNGGTNPVYQWKINGQNAGTNLPTFTTHQLNHNDLVSVEMQANLACPSPAKAISNTIPITVYPKPSQPVILHEKSGELKSDVTGLNYQWYKDEVLLSANTATLSVQSLGTYQVAVQTENCTSELSTPFVLDAEALKQFNAKTSIFPNPNEGKFTLKIPNNAGSTVKIALYNTQGKVLFQKDYPATDLIDFEEEIQTRSLDGGVYWLKIQNNKQAQIRKIIINR